MPGPPSSSSGRCPRRAKCFLCLTTSSALPHACLDNFFTCSFTSSPRGVAASAACTREPWGLGSVAAQAWLVPRRQLLNSGCLGRGRPVYPGQGPGRGCSFLPTPMAHHTDSAVPICICSFHQYLWSAYCVPSTVLHAAEVTGDKRARFPALVELTL